jgi:glycosyltransferase involved in cell wall biosynthesis
VTPPAKSVVAEPTSGTPPKFTSISLVVPVFNERGTLDELYAELTAVLPTLTDQYEILFINDGSTDGSGEIIEAIAARDSRVRHLWFRYNQGKANALNLGFAESDGDVVVTMDADLQDKPSELPRLLNALDGYDLVSGWKKIRHDPLSKTLPSKLFNRITAIVSGVRLHDFNCGFKAYRSDVVKELDLYGEMHRFIPAIAAWRGFRVTEVPVDHAPRKWGRSKYGVSRLFKGAYDLLTVTVLNRFGSRPMHFFGTVGVLLGSAGFVILLYMSYMRLIRDETIGTRPLLFLGIVLLLAGIQLVSTGLIGELVVRRTRPQEARPADRRVK